MVRFYSKELDAIEIEKLGLCVLDEGQDNIINIQPGFRVDNISGRLKVVFKGNNNTVNIGKDVFVHRSLTLSFVPGGGMTSDNCLINIGDNCIFNGNRISFLCGEKGNIITVGDDCLFAGAIKLTTSDNHTIYDLDSGAKLNLGGDIYIGNHVWICEGVTVLNNTTIGDNTVLATRCVVTGSSIKGNVVIGGIPGRIIRENCNWDIVCNWNEGLR